MVKMVNGKNGTTNPKSSRKIAKFISYPSTGLFQAPFLSQIYLHGEC